MSDQAAQEIEGKPFMSLRAPCAGVAGMATNAAPARDADREGGGTKTISPIELADHYCAIGRFVEAFEVEHHDELENLKQDWLLRDKITTLEAREIYSDLRAKWFEQRRIDPSVWPPPYSGALNTVEA